jgi:hypothetical protein
VEDKRSYPQLSADIAAAAQQVTVGALYRHYKNQHLYKVLGFAIAEASNEVVVLYQPQAEGSDITFTRPLSEWMAEITRPEGAVQRFTLQATS